MEVKKNNVAEASHRATKQKARAGAAADEAKNFDQLRLVAEGRTNASEEALKLANERISKLEADLEDLKKAKEEVESKTSKAFQVGKDAALESYVEEVPKFEKRGFKHNWLKPLVAANVIS